MARMVECAKIGQELPGLASPPYAGELGQRIFENISQSGWDMWIQYSVVLINHYGLSLGDPRSRDFLMQQMEEFFLRRGRADAGRLDARGHARYGPRRSRRKGRAAQVAIGAT